MSRGEVSFQIKDIGYAISQIGGAYERADSAFKESLNNSIDARLNDGVSIVLIANKEQKNLIQTDNGIGMTLDQLKAIPQSIGSSQKRFQEGKIGRRQFGFLAFLSFARGCRIISRKIGQGDEGYNFLHLQREEIEGQKPTASYDVLNAKQIKDLGLVPIEHGTYVLIDGIEKEDLFDNYFSPPKLARLFGELYSPLIREGDVSITVKGTGYRNRKPIQVHPPEYKGEKVLDEIIEVEYTGKDEKTGEKVGKIGNMDILLYIDPEASAGKVGHYNNGLRIMSSLTSLEEFNHAPWNTGKLVGEINEDFLPLNISNTAPLPNSKRLEIFQDALRRYETNLNSRIKRLVVSRQKSKEEEFAEQLLRHFDKAYKDFYDAISSLSRGFGRSDKQKQPKGIVNGIIDKGGGKGRRKIGREQRRDTGKKDFGKGIKKTLSGNYSVSFEPFDIEENHKMSRLDEHMGVIAINTSHSEFENLESEKDKRIYSSSLIATRIAQGELTKVRGKEVLDEETGIEWMVNLREHLYQHALRSLNLI
jgi:hypothetical protein